MNDIKILTIPFDTTTGLFEDEALTGYLRGREVIDAQPQFFTHQNRPYWSICIVSRKYRGGG